MGKLIVAFGDNVKVRTNQTSLFSTSMYYNYIPFSITFFIRDVYCYSSRHTKLTVSRSGARQIPRISWKKNVHLQWMLQPATDTYYEPGECSSITSRLISLFLTLSRTPYFISPYRLKILKFSSFQLFVFLRLLSFNHSKDIMWRAGFMKLLSICVSPSSVASALLFEIFLSAPCYQFPSVCVPHLDRKVKLHTTQNNK